MEIADLVPLVLIGLLATLVSIGIGNVIAGSVDGVWVHRRGNPNGTRTEVWQQIR